ncbi:hypothetical protein O181_009021 [Austropuccinia psidii MF-1]|uniref:Uncharacterized protein n=1 Tax=Austropuccinia psidii MF-1 TaxID=1389203 RepID=A0A9Q3BNJ5_9BASI|nr:hypothetical protein [Austropuccinia psidii MF-1]
MEDARTFTSSQRLASTFDTCLDSREADITAIPVNKSEIFPTGNSGNIPVSLQELVYGGKIERIGASSKRLDRDNEHLYSIEQSLWRRKDRGPSEGLDSNVLQRESPTDKSLFKRTKAYFKRTRIRSWPKRRKKALWKLLKPPQVSKRVK